MSLTTALPASPALRAGLVMILAMASFTAGDTMTKLMAGEVPVGQIIFFRGVVATAITALLARKALARAMLVFQKGVLVRSLSDVAGTIFFITALMHIPIANLTAVMQAVPLLVIAFAALFLGETVGWRRVLAILLGLTGVLFIVKPSPASFTIYDALSLGLIMAIALRDIFTRRLNFDVPTMIIVFANAVFVMLSGLLLYPFETWVALTPRHLLLIFCGGILLSIGYVCMVMTIRMGDISATAIYRYSVVLFA
ncbi:MAG: DMT family transporter, partial [Solimonas sp.]